MKTTVRSFSWAMAYVLAMSLNSVCGASESRALIRHAPMLNGAVQGSIQVMTAEKIVLSGSAVVTGDLLVPGMPAVHLNGHPAYGGTQDGFGAVAPSNYQITLNGRATLRHIIRRTDPVVLPVVDVPPRPSGTRNVVIQVSRQSPGDFVTIRNLTLNEKTGSLAVPPGVYGDFTANGGSGFILGMAGAAQPANYALERLTLNGNARLEVVSPVVLTIGNGVTLNGHVGAVTNPVWLQLRVANAGMTLNGGSKLFGEVSVPNGTVIINGNSRLVGSLACDRLILNGNSLLQLVTANQPPVVTMSAPANGASLIAFTAVTLNATATDPDGSINGVEFFSGATKLGDGTPVAGQPSTYTLDLTSGLPVGTYTFTAKAIDSAGATATSAPVCVSVTLASNQPPAAALTAPTEGSRFAANTAVMLLATASDVDGAIAKVEFFDGATKLGDGSSVSDQPGAFNLTFSFASAGSHTLRIRATDDDGAFADSAPVPMTVLASLPYTADFEAAEGYSLGPLAGQLGWSVVQGGGSVTDEAFFSGARSAVLSEGSPPTRIAQDFAPLAGQGIVFVDFYAKPVADTDLNTATTFDVESSRFALMRNGTNGELHAFDGDGVGNGQWQPTGFSAPLGSANQTQNWIRFTPRLDFVHKTWDFYADGRMVAADLAFRDTTSTGLTLFAAQGHPAAATRFDYLLASTENPLFADADHDGMDDAWEVAHGLDPTVNDRAGDLDGDGLSNIREYLLGLAPNNPDSDGDGLYDGDEVFWGWGPLTPNPDSVAPTAPTGLAASVTTDTVNLSWQPATDDLRVAGYIVYRNGQPIETAQPIRETHYSDTGLPDDEVFNYQVRAFDFAGNLSPLSERRSVHTAAVDTDDNGLPDAWEQKYFSQTGVDPNVDEDGDGLTNLQEYLNGTDPKDFYNGVVPTHDVLYGGRPGPADQLAMIVRHPDGSPWPNAPVNFDITSGRRRISASSGGPYGYHVMVRADTNGLAQCYLEPLNQ